MSIIGTGTNVVATAHLVSLQMSRALTCVQAKYQSESTPQKFIPGRHVLEMVIQFGNVDKFEFYGVPFQHNAFPSYNFELLPGFVNILAHCQENSSPERKVAYGSKVNRYLEQESDLPGVDMGSLIAWQTAKIINGMANFWRKNELTKYFAYTSAGKNFLVQMKRLAKAPPQFIKFLGLNLGAPPELAKKTGDVRYELQSYHQTIAKYSKSTSTRGVLAHFLAKK